MITVNGGKVTHAHAFPSKDKPEDWYYTARLDGIQLHPMKMSKEDVTAYQNKEISVKDMMEKYYPTKIAKSRLLLNSLKRTDCFLTGGPSTR